MTASHVTSYTLVGVIGRPPFRVGNCFSVLGEDGRDYRILNFVYENLQELERHGLTWPLEIRPLSKYDAVLHDPRIPDSWYPKEFCEVCCPRELLPLPQRLEQERHILQGIREERGGIVIRHNRPPTGVISV